MPWRCSEIDSIERKDLHDRYGVDAVPMVLVADAVGTVRANFVGEPTATDLWAALAELARAGHRAAELHRRHLRLTDQLSVAAGSGSWCTTGPERSPRSHRRRTSAPSMVSCSSRLRATRSRPLRCSVSSSSQRRSHVAQDLLDLFVDDPGGLVGVVAGVP